MRYFVQIRNQKIKRIQVLIDRNAVAFARLGAEIAEAGAARAGGNKIKLVAQPQPVAVVERQRRQVLLQNFSHQIVGHDIFSLKQITN